MTTTTASTAAVTRRAILRVGAVGIGAGTLVGATQGAANAAPAPGPAPASGVLTLAAIGDPVDVVAPNGTAVTLPRSLGAALRARQHIAAGARVTLTWDARTHVADTELTLMRGADVVETVPVAVTTDPATRTSTLTAVLGHGLRARGEYEVVAGASSTSRFPDDLVTDPAPVQVALHDRHGQPLGEATLGGSARPGAVPWGASLGVAWEEVVWDDRFRTVYPTAVTIRAVGPAELPSGHGVRVIVDAQVAGEPTTVTAIAPDGTEVLGASATTTDGGLVTTTWTAAAPLPADAYATVLLGYEPREVRGSLAHLVAPLVQFTTEGPTPPNQRHTGAESLTRDDSVHALATLAGG